MILNYCVSLIILVFNCIFYEKYLHIWQLKDYNATRYLSHFKNKFWLCAFYLILFLLEIIFKNYILNVCLNMLALIVNLWFISKLITSNKTPLNYTGKIKRLYAISAIILALISIFYYGAIISIFVLLFLPIIANFLNIYDKIINKKYIKSAQKKLAASKAKIIAITGSNGKTSVKNILAEMLKKYNVLASPKSYNTPLGISKFINDSNLENCNYIILEYGARHLGDVKKLCKIFGADYGIITLVAPQHLESFKTMHNIFKAKKELADFLGERLCVYNLDNIYTYKMYAEKIGKKVGVSIYNNADIYLTDLQIKNFKTEFKIHYKNKAYSAKTKLLGRHNSTNILLATALALNLGVDMADIVDTIKKLNYIPHRLELIKSNINILDDSYNCSLASAKEALNVLQYCPNKKVVATPGIIEGGDCQFDINYELGEMLACADEVIVIGNTNKNALTRGMENKKFKKYKCVKTLDDAKIEFNKLKKNDTLLLLNDLPDDYK